MAGRTQVPHCLLSDNERARQVMKYRLGATARTRVLVTGLVGNLKYEQRARLLQGTANRHIFVTFHLLGAGGRREEGQVR